MALLVIAATIFLRVRYHGENLATEIEAQINGRIRGQVTIGSIDWPLSAVPRAAVGAAVPLTIHDVTVRDARGEVVIRAPVIHAGIEPWDLVSGHFVFTHIDIPDGGYALIEQIPSPHPGRPDDRAVSLIAAFAPPGDPAYHAGMSARSGPLFDLGTYSVSGVTLEFRYPTFSAIAHDVTGKGTLVADGSDPLAFEFYYALSPHADNARVTVGPVTLDVPSLEVAKLQQVRADDDPQTSPPFEWAAIATEASGARIEVQGALASRPAGQPSDMDIHVALSHGGGLLEDLSGGIAGGNDAGAEITLRGPSSGPAITAEAHAINATLQSPALTLVLDSATATLDTATGEGSLDDTVIRGAGGRIEVSATGDLSPGSATASINITEPLDLSPYVPKKVARLAGTTLSGRLDLHGDRQRQVLDPKGLRLGRARVSGTVVHEGDTVRTDGLTVDVGGTEITARRAVVDLARRIITGADLSIRSHDVASILRKIGAPRLATGLSGTARVWGPLASPRATASITARGVPAIDRAHANLAYSRGVVSVNRATANAFSGKLEASARYDIASRRLSDARADISGVDLSQIPGLGAILNGTAEVHAKANGPAAWPSATITTTIDELAIAGESYPTFDLRAKTLPGRVLAADLAIEGARGGTFSANVSTRDFNALSGNVDISAIPVESLMSLASTSPSPITGLLSTHLELGGSVGAPTASGTIAMVRTTLRQAFLGAANLEIKPAGERAITLTGRMFQGRVEVAATISTRAPFFSHVDLKLHRIELDRYAPALAERLGARAFVSGTAVWDGPLIPVPNKPPKAALHITEAVAIIDDDDATGRPAPIRLSATEPITVSIAEGTASIDGEAVIKGPAGDLRISGTGTTDELDFKLRGQVAVALLQPYLRQQLDNLAGTVGVDLTVAGAMAKPRISGVLAIDDVELSPVGQDALIRVPEGKIQFTNDQLVVTGLSMVVVDEYSHETSELSVAGGIKLEQFVPRQWALQISGQLGGKMLLVLVPQAFSAASGHADLSIALAGTGPVPDIDGVINFDTEDPLLVTPRGLRREIVLNQGVVRFTDQLVEVEHLAGWVDDAGRIVDISGEISLDAWVPVDIDLSVDADDLPFRVPRTLEVTVDLRDFRVVGGFDQGLEIAGNVIVNDGRYIQKWHPLLSGIRNSFSPQYTSEATPPLYKSLPILAAAKLHLGLDIRTFFVNNNIADFQLAGGVVLTGTPIDPRLDGQVRVEHGSFKIPAVRADFQRTSGTITFERLRDLPDDTPTLNLRSESDYRDTSGHDYLVILTVEGPLSNIQWNLSTTSGLNKAQTLALISLGRTPDQARRTLGTQPVGRDVGEIQGTKTTADTSSGIYAADQIVKDLAGDFLSLLVEDSIRNFTGLDVARLELG
ncbi:MAG TPA: translocation/assembly module TamB domain-containing protein, partial [Kofleriaceae bacterium]|nr:translocation/assembly module TamB domain-containing protein [Kofleriaceae bacterium]